METFDIFPCCMMKFLLLLLPALSYVHTHAHTVKRLLTNLQTARGSSTDVTVLDPVQLLLARYT